MEPGGRGSRNGRYRAQTLRQKTRARKRRAILDHRLKSCRALKVEGGEALGSAVELGPEQQQPKRLVRGIGAAFFDRRDVRACAPRAEESGRVHRHGRPLPGCPAARPPASSLELVSGWQRGILTMNREPEPGRLVTEICP